MTQEDFPDEQFFTGEGGGSLRFRRNGELYILNEPERMRKWTYEDTARSLVKRGNLKMPRSSANHGFFGPVPDSIKALLSLPDFALLAATLIDALYEGDAETFRRLAKIVASPSEPDDIHSKHNLLTDAIARAASLAKGVPTREQVRDILSKIPGPDGTGKMFNSVHKSDKMQELLESVGFGWLPHRKRGEHLKR